MGRILIIPHAPATPLRTRAGELARALASEGHEVEIFKRNLQPSGLSLAGKLRWHATEAFTLPVTEEIAPGVKAITAPALHRGGRMVNLANRLASELLRRRKYDLIVTEAYDGLIIRRIAGTKLVYDLVDDHAAGWLHAGRADIAEKTEKHVERQIYEADQVIASGHLLGELCSSRYGKKADLVFNGADVGRIRAALRDTTLPSDPVIGYVGGLDEFVRIDLVVGAVERLRKSAPALELVVVGDGPAIRGKTFPTWVKCLGFKPAPEIPGILGGFTVGIVPFELSPFTDAALPLKVLEYGAARRVSVSSPLKELQHHRLPWVIFSDLTEDSWADALNQALSMNWSPAWDSIVDRYDWRAGARHLVEVTLG